MSIQHGACFSYMVMLSCKSAAEAKLNFRDLRDPAVP
jgi:hypothetical protein